MERMASLGVSLVLAATAMGRMDGAMQATALPDAPSLIAAGKDIYWVCDKTIQITSLGGQSLSERYRTVRRLRITNVTGMSVKALYWSDARRAEPNVELTNLSLDSGFVILDTVQVHSSDPQILAGDNTFGHYYWPEERRFTKLSGYTSELYNDTHVFLMDNKGYNEGTYAGLRYKEADKRPVLHDGVTTRTAVFEINALLEPSRFFRDSELDGTETKTDNSLHSLSEFIPGLFLAANAPRSTSQGWGGSYIDTRYEAHHNGGAWDAYTLHGVHSCLLKLSGRRTVDGQDCAIVQNTGAFNYEFAYSNLQEAIHGPQEDEGGGQAVRLKDGLLQSVDFTSTGRFKVKGTVGDGMIKTRFWRSDTMPLPSKAYPLRNWAG